MDTANKMSGDMGVLHRSWGHYGISPSIYWLITTHPKPVWEGLHGTGLRPPSRLSPEKTCREDPSWEKGGLDLRGD